MGEQTSAEHTLPERMVVAKALRVEEAPLAEEALPVAPVLAVSNLGGSLRSAVVHQA